MQDLGKKLSASFTGLSGVASPGSLKDAADGIEKAADLLDDAAGNFDDIEPPKEIESAHQELVDGAHEAADEFRDLADQIRNGDLNLQQEFDPSKLEGFRRIQRGIDAIKAKGYSIGEAG
jgi:hypothetical protein